MANYSKHRKEHAVTKPKIKHIAAVTRAQHLLETGINVDGNPKLRKSIEDDIATLCEVRQILYQFIENPTLPFTVVIVNEPNAAF